MQPRSQEEAQRNQDEKLIETAKSSKDATRVCHQSFLPEKRMNIHGPPVSPFWFVRSTLRFPGDLSGGWSACS
jgi:hypothetical protein